MNAVYHTKHTKNNEAQRRITNIVTLRTTEIIIKHLIINHLFSNNKEIKQVIIYTEFL